MSIDLTNVMVCLKPQSQISVDDFVDFWAAQYNYPFDNLYLDNINRNQFELIHIQQLYEWKNGMTLSSLKGRSLEKQILNNIDIVNGLKVKFDNQIFIKEFGDVSTIWQIFLKHIIMPSNYPIFDMHVYRSFKYFELREKDARLPYSDDRRLQIYEKEYCPFYSGLENLCIKNTSKKLDEALWAFGKFLANYPKMIIC